MSVGWARKQECPHPLKMPVPVYLFLYWFLDLKQIMNLPERCLMISGQDKALLMYMINLEVSEGG